MSYKSSNTAQCRLPCNDTKIFMDNIEYLLEKLSTYPNTNMVANPYNNSYAVDNLRLYFKYVFNQKGKRILLVGEAPGYKGCGITGIPFTSGRIFHDLHHPLLRYLKDKITLPFIESENTAKIVWEYLTAKNLTPLFWNSFPFHPHDKGNKISNRTPTKQEIEFGSDILKELSNIYQPDVIAGIGRKGAAALSHVFPGQSIKYIRHPSRGGKTKFIEGINTII